MLVGATTENPYFEVNSALLSRCRIYELRSLDEEHVLALLRRALGARAWHPGRAARGRRRARVPRRSLGGRRAHRAVGAGAGGRDRRRERRGHAARGRGRAPAQRDPLRQGRRPPLRPDLGLDQVDARLGPGRVAPVPGGDARGRRGPALHRPPDGRVRERGHRQRRPACARGGGERRTRGGARRAARMRAEPRAGGGVPGARAEVECLLRGDQAGARVGARARHARAARRRSAARPTRARRSSAAGSTTTTRTRIRRECPSRS